MAWPDWASSDPLRHTALLDLVGLVSRRCLVVARDRTIILAGGDAQLWFGADCVGRSIDEVARRATGGPAGELGDLPEGTARELITPRNHEAGLDVDVTPGVVAGHDVSVWTILTDPLGPSETALGAPAPIDDLTGLPSRVEFLDELTSELDLGHDVAVLLVDLDRFRAVNDQLGHDIGDQLLRAVADRIARTVGTGNLLARFAGDEFVVLCRDPDDVADPTEVARRMSEALSEPFTISGEPLTTSIGIATSVGAASSFSTGLRDAASLLLNHADAALYRAKELGRGRFEVYDAEVERFQTCRREMELSLRSALERDEFELAFQPVVSIATGKVEGAEALLRWRRSGSVVPPDEFIAIAEQTGLIVPIGEWVIAEASRTLADWDARWPDNGLTMAVNVSARQISSPDIVERLGRAVASAGVEPNRIAIEITESVLLGDAEEALVVLRALRDAGFGLAMDDFGTGYSSLTYLRKFPIDTVKIDRSFVAPVNESNDDATIVSMIVALAHSLGLRIVAEGVESFEQAATLYALRCHLGQGFYWSRPLSPDAAVDWLARSLESGKVTV